MRGSLIDALRRTPTLDPVRLVFIDLAIRSGRPSGAAARASEDRGRPARMALKRARFGVDSRNEAVIQLEGSPNDG